MPAPLHQIKFLRILQSFSPAELKDFAFWLQSPWCNTNKNLLRLLDRLQKHHPDFEAANVDKKHLFRQVLPKSKYSNRRMNNLLSEAYLAAERFLVFQRFSQEEGLQQELLAQVLEHRSFDDWFFKNTYREIERVEEKAVKSWEDQVELFRLYRLVYHHPSQAPRMAQGKDTISRMGAQLDLAYLLEKAGIINEMIARNRLFQNEHHTVDKERKRWQAASAGVHHPAVELYRLRFAYTEKNFLDQYRALRIQLIGSMDLLDEKEQKLHLLSLLNDTMRLVKSGQLDITDSLPLYQLGLKTGILLHEGKLSRNTYTTIVTASNTKGDFRFTHDFIEGYSGKLEASIQADCASWARAHTAYWQGQLEACLDLLREHPFGTPYFQLISRVLTVQAYFDLYLQDEAYRAYLFNFFDAFERWLNRDKLWSQSGKTAFIRFVQQCRTLAKYYGDADFKPDKVRALLQEEGNIQALNWLRQRQGLVLRLRAS